jgi:GNAT superfamily N-acetyltransferase
MTLPEPLRSFWSAWGALNPVCDPTPWGLVVADPRFPAVWESNHAAVFSDHRTITPEEIRDSLLPVLHRARALYEHVEFWDPPLRCRALRAMRAEADHSGVDSVMVFEGDPAGLPDDREPGVRVRHLRRPGARFWQVYTTSRSEFGGSMDEATIRALVRRDREVLVPGGLQTFAGYVDGELAGFASLISLAGVGYVDNVVTLPRFRRRGVASATTGRAVRESLANGDGMVHLLTAEGGGPVRLYEGLGFRPRAAVASVTRRLRPDGRPRSGR